uniref:Putative secreted protein n=1 Tax=Ixodes ricinus TaxID=34613 RepID=A0A6B0U9A8_IXORI
MISVAVAKLSSALFLLQTHYVHKTSAEQPLYSFQSRPTLFLVHILDLNFVIKRDSYLKVIGYFSFCDKRNILGFLTYASGKYFIPSKVVSMFEWLLGQVCLPGVQS